MDREPALLRVKQVAKLLNVGVRTVQKMADQGNLVSIRLPNARGDRRISLESVKLLLQKDGVEIDLRELAGTAATSWPVVVAIGVPEGIIQKLSFGESSNHKTNELLFGAGLIGKHNPDVVILDATAMTDGNQAVQVILDLVRALCHECTVILRCYDDPAMYDPRMNFAQAITKDPLLEVCDESAIHLNQAVLAALNRKGKASA